MLANGQVEIFDVYVATLVWDEHPVRVMADAAATTLLIGMGLLQGFDLNIRAIDGGAVTIQRILHS